jgi:hypothetical protein
MREGKGSQASGRLRHTATSGGVAPGRCTLVDQVYSSLPPHSQHAGTSVPSRPAANAPGSSGAPLPRLLLGKMNRAFGADFSSVRVHQDERAAGLGARALTQGNEIHFAPGQYDPDSQTGQELIGHELAHVVQQRQGRVTANAHSESGPVNVDSTLEAEADRQGAEAARGLLVGGVGPTSPQTAADAPMQAKLGFEFQTHWKLFKKRPDTESLDRVPSKSAEMRFAPSDSTEWHIEIDDDEIEFVLDPPLETPAAISRVIGAMATKAKQIATAASGRPQFPAAEIDWPTPARDAEQGSQLVVKAADPEIGARAQATMGIALDRIEHLLRFLASPRDLGSHIRPSAKQMELFKKPADLSPKRLHEWRARQQVQRTPIQRAAPDPSCEQDSRQPTERPVKRPRADASNLTPDRGTLSFFEKRPKRCRSMADHALSSVEKAFGEYVPDTMPRLRGLLYLVAYYLMLTAGKSKQTLEYPKAVFDLMARNDFVAAFATLGPDEREQFRRLVGVDREDKQQPPKDVDYSQPLETFMFDIERTLDSRVFGTAYKRPDTEQSEEGPHIKDWLQSIATGYSEADSRVLRKDLLSPPPGYAHDRDLPANRRESMGSLDQLEESHRLRPGQRLEDGELLAEGAAATDNRRFEKVSRMVLELRDFGRWILAESWQTFALAMSELLHVTTGEMPSQFPAGTAGNSAPANAADVQEAEEEGPESQAPPRGDLSYGCSDQGPSGSGGHGDMTPNDDDRISIMAWMAARATPGAASTAMIPSGGAMSGPSQAPERAVERNQRKRTEWRPPETPDGGDATAPSHDEGSARSGP